MVIFFNSERVDMVMLYGVAEGNARLASFPNDAIPCVRTCTSVVQHLRDLGIFKPQTYDRDRERTERILQSEEQILEHAEEEPNISTRRLAAEVGVSQFLVHRTFQEQGLHPYNIEKVQALEPSDLPCRVSNLLRMVVTAMSSTP
ncbi:hypothetical protein Zmor_024089 [Zophobas morio]|uniref:Uncharacterized protein n=1 Tax=Zophobas morio TaxID=2755281 RepID=A0AA38HZJ3_9CUCU|nr:hypothetical protein Zmor_024089 [Zophobas morio]